MVTDILHHLRDNLGNGSKEAQTAPSYKIRCAFLTLLWKSTVIVDLYVLENNSPFGFGGFMNSFLLWW